MLFALLLGLFLAPLWHGFGSWLLLDSWRGEPILVSFYSLVGYFLAVPHVRGPVTYSLFWIGPVRHALHSLVLTYLGPVSPCGYSYPGQSHPRGKAIRCRVFGFRGKYLKVELPLKRDRFPYR